MKNVNPLYREGVKPSHVLYSISSILCLMGMLQAQENGNGELILSEKGRDGFYFMLDITDETICQLAEAVQI